MSFTVQVSHGPDKHAVEVESSEATVAHLKESVTKLTEIPPDAQKLIFKGKTLQDDTKLLSDIGVKQGSRLMVLGRKSGAEESPFIKEIAQVTTAVDAINKKMDGISDEITGIEKGFVQAELVTEACKGLHKRCLACGELLMQNMEKLDSIAIPPNETLVRGRKKSTIIRIQTLLTRNDELIKRTEAIKAS